MRARSCADLAELRSAYVDGALANADRERLLAHLVGCAECRRDVSELRRVRSLLTAADPALAPVDLSHRLVSIAGEEAHQPLWTRPFRRTSTGDLPSRRRAIRLRLTAGVLACGFIVLTVFGVGYLAAPSVAAAPPVEPTAVALTEFTSVVSQFPLDGRVSAALRGIAPRPASTNPVPTALSVPAKPLSAAKTAAMLDQAGRASDELTYTGTQVVSVTRDGTQLSNSVRVSSRGSAGTSVVPVGTDQRNTDVAIHIESNSSSRMTDADLIDRLRARYRLRGWSDQWIGHRSAYVVEAVEPAAHPSVGELDGVVARWWIDSETKLPLAQERFDGRGGLELSSRLADLRYGSGGDDQTRGGDVEPRTTATLTLSRTADLRRNGWICVEQLAGLPLLRLRIDQTNDPELVHLVYSDGLVSVSVVEQRGRLTDSATSGRWSETLSSWVSEGMPTAATWSSSDVVLTVVTDGSRETLAAAVAALPHDAVGTPTTMERVRAGWSRILGR
ncbi:MAG: zf-HC2 domain-containing protein [Microlunatus sp.]|nr:zf-HC2 domain-containing protein [Microlunatus sp.]